MNSFRMAKPRPWLDYLSSDSGKNAMRVTAGLAGATVGFGFFLAPQCLAVDWLKDTLQMYHEGFPVKPSAHVIDLAAEALADCQVTETDSKLIKWFTAFGFQPIHKGQVSMKHGAIIGIPKTFSYNAPEDVDRAIIKMHRDTSIPWKSEAGQALLQSILFSDDARRFGLAREIISCQTNHVYIKTVAIGVMLPSFTVASSVLNERFGLHRYPLKFRIGIHTLWTVIGVLTTIALWEFINRFYESDADEQVAKLGRNYIQGAIEYYSKQMLLNRALREMLGTKEGHSSYTAEGNVNYLLHQPHLALSGRKGFFEKKLQELNQQEEEKHKEKQNVTL